jgi:hypothetical protein
MTHTVANVAVGGRPYTIVGPLKETITDVTVTSNSETVTAAELGLNAIFAAEAEIQTGQATDTGVYATAIVASSGLSAVVAEFAAAGTAATTAADTVVRVKARGY